MYSRLPRSSNELLSNVTSVRTSGAPGSSKKNPMITLLMRTITRASGPTAMVFEQTGTDPRYFTDHDHRRFKETLRIPLYTSAWIGRYTGDWNLWTGGVEMGVEGGPGTGVVYTITAGRLAMQILVGAPAPAQDSSAANWRRDRGRMRSFRSGPRCSRNSGHWGWHSPKRADAADVGGAVQHTPALPGWCVVTRDRRCTRVEESVVQFSGTYSSRM
jgi:hypothetical protein